MSTNNKRGKVGTSGREIAASLYGTRGRPLNYLEQTRESDNAHLAKVARAARGEADPKPVKFVAPRADKWAAARARHSTKP